MNVFVYLFDAQHYSSSNAGKDCHIIVAIRTIKSHYTGPSIGCTFYYVRFCQVAISGKVLHANMTKPHYIERLLPVYRCPFNIESACTGQRLALLPHTTPHLLQRDQPIRQFYGFRAAKHNSRPSSFGRLSCRLTSLCRRRFGSAMAYCGDDK